MWQHSCRINEIRKRERNQSNLRHGDPLQAQDNGNRPHQVSLLEAISIGIINKVETVLVDLEDPVDYLEDLVDFQQYKIVVHKL